MSSPQLVNRQVLVPGVEARDRRRTVRAVMLKAWLFRPPSSGHDATRPQFGDLRFCGCQAAFRLCDVEGLLAERSILVTYETVRVWIARFGPLIARHLRRRRGLPTPRATELEAFADEQAKAFVRRDSTAIIRRRFGVAGAAHQNGGRLNWRYAWPSGRWGSLPLEGGIEAAYRADIASAPDPKAKLQEIETRLNALRSPFRSAEKFWVEEIIDPRETRPYLCRFIDAAQGKLRTTVGPKAKYGVRP